MLTVLILTHNRPALFDRCIKSVLPLLDGNVRVIVNNDSNDITPIEHPDIEYHFEKFGNLSQVYQFLLSKATGEYVYYLEDDDYLEKNFTLDVIDQHCDIIAGNYCPTYETPDMIKMMTLYHDNTVTPQYFLRTLNFEHLQLSQFIFRKKAISDFVFPMDNNVHNDINLVMHAATNSTLIATKRKIFFHQTIDGGDNISFVGTNKSIETTASLEFVENYGL